MIYRIKYLFSDLILFIKSKYQLLKYGYEFRDCWSLDYSAATWLVPRLKHLKKTKYGIPLFCYKNHQNHTKVDDRAAIKKWNNILDEMIFAFEFTSHEEDNWKLNDKKYKELSKRALNGRLLFARYFCHLWD